MSQVDLFPRLCRVPLQLHATCFLFSGKTQKTEILIEFSGT